MEEAGYKINATYFESGMFFVGQYSEGVDESWDIDDSSVPEELNGIGERGHKTVEQRNRRCAVHIVVTIY